MNLTQRYENQSNLLYNDGLSKALIRDLTGAVVSLRKSLQLNRNNSKARNLLGLVYYGRGEVVEAIVEWIICKNLAPTDPQADYYINAIQRTPKQLEVVNQAIKRYNSVLHNLDPSNFDVSIVQLKQVVEGHPEFVKGLQLLALIYLLRENWLEAREILKKTRKLDTTDEITLRYIHELMSNQKRRSKASSFKRNNVVEYQEGNTKIIQPRAMIYREIANHVQFVNLIIGVVIGASLIWFLIAPAVNQNRQNRINAQQVEFSQRIQSMEAQISAQTRQLDEYRAQNVNTDEVEQVTLNAQESYEALLLAREQFDSGNFTFETITDTLLSISSETLGTRATAMYQELVDAVFPTVVQRRYDEGLANFDVANFRTATENFGRVVQMDPTFAHGHALLLLGLSYQGLGDETNALLYLNQVLTMFPDSEAYIEATNAIEAIQNPTEPTSTNGTTGTDTNQTTTETTTTTTGTPN